MTTASEALSALRDAYEKVKLWPENRMPGVDITELGEGFIDLLHLRNAVPAALSALSHPQEAVERRVLDDSNIHGWHSQDFAFLRQHPQHTETFTNELGNEISLIAWTSASNPLAVRFILLKRGLIGRDSHTFQDITPMEAEKLIVHLQAALGHTLFHPEPVAQEAVAWPHKASELEAAAIYLDEVDDDETESVRRVAAFLRAVAAQPSPSPEQGEDDLDRFMELVSEGNFYTDYDQSIDTLGKARRALSALRARVAELEARATPPDSDAVLALRECIKQLDTIIEDGTPTDFRLWRDDLLATLSNQGSSSNG